jgi:hypothetical protein
VLYQHARNLELAGEAALAAEAYRAAFRAVEDAGVRLPNAMARFTITAIHSDPSSGAEDDEHEEADGGLLQAAALTPNAGGNGSRLESLPNIGTPYCQATHLPALLPIAVAGPSMHSRFPPQVCVTPSSPLDEAEAQLESTGAQAGHGVPPASSVGYGLEGAAALQQPLLPPAEHRDVPPAASRCDLLRMSIRSILRALRGRGTQ